MIKTLMSQVREYRTAALLTPLFTALEVFLEILIPYIIAFLIDRGIEAGSLENVIHYGLIMLAISLCSLLCGVLAGRYAAFASAGFASNLRDAMYRNIQRFSFSNIDKYSTAGLITRMTTDVTNLQNAFQMLIRIAVRAPLTMVTALIMCFSINSSISMIFLGALAILAVCLTYIISHATAVFTQVFRRYDDLNASVQENVTGIRVVKAFVREEYEIGRFRKAADTLYRMFVKAEKLIIMNMPVMNLVVYGCMILISWFGAHHIVSGTMTTGSLTSLFSYVMNVLFSLMMLSMIFVMLTMSAASARRITEVIREEPDITDPEDPVTEITDGSIVFEDVDFAYGNFTSETDADPVNGAVPAKTPEELEDTLHDVTLSIRSGETVGILGPTGSGKSTLVSLISRLYDVGKGRVLVGGKDVRSYSLSVLRDNVSVVLQKNVLFSGTILENLRWGKPDATEEECRHACELACADEFIDTLPDGYGTVLEAGGTNLSGGQRQRLCIARALLKSPKILILDDSTSACDTATDARIRAAFRTWIPDTTRLIITQRIQSIMDADRILLLDNGRVLAFDNHERLLETSPEYRELYELQTKTGGDFDEPGSVS